MEDNLKSLITTISIAALFITAITSFITLFPQEQGFSFQNVQDNQGYLEMQSYSEDTFDNQLSNSQDALDSGFNDWDITQGFMGSNSIKQSSKESVKSSFIQVSSGIKSMAILIFGQNSPVVYVIIFLTTLGVTLITLSVIKFLRQGQ